MWVRIPTGEVGKVITCLYHPLTDQHYIQVQCKAVISSYTNPHDLEEVNAPGK